MSEDHFPRKPRAANTLLVVLVGAGLFAVGLLVGIIISQVNTPEP